jgi:hypothetical protein
MLKILGDFFCSFTSLSSSSSLSLCFKRIVIVESGAIYIYIYTLFKRDPGRERERGLFS